MAVTSIPAASTEYIHVPVTASVQLDTQTVEQAYLTGATTPDDLTTWYAAEWEGSIGTTRSCRVLVGPGAGGATSFTANTTINVYVRVTDTPEIPVRLAGQIKLT